MYLTSLRDLDPKAFVVSKPIYIKENIGYRRNEKMGNITCHSKKSPFAKELVINSVALKILDFCDGTRTPIDITNELIKIYNGVTKEVVANDLVKVLFEYTKHGFIEWEGGMNPFMYTREKKLANGYSVSLADETSLRELFGFMKQAPSGDITTYYNPTRSVVEYEDEVLYRQKLFSYSEEFFLLKKDGKIEGVVTILIPAARNSSVSSVGLIRIAPEYLEEVINFAKEILPEIAVKDISKIKYLSVEGEETHKKFEGLVSKAGFVKECTLIKEVFEKNMDVYSYIY